MKILKKTSTCVSVRRIPLRERGNERLRYCNLHLYIVLRHLYTLQAFSDFFLFDRLSSRLMISVLLFFPTSRGTSLSISVFLTDVRMITQIEVNVELRIRVRI